MKTKFGYMQCPDCGERVVVKQNENETLAYRCDECDGNGYTRKGEGRYQSWIKKITRTAPVKPEAKPEAKPAPGKPDTKPARKSLTEEFNS